MDNPFADLMQYACDQACAKYFAGEMSFDEALDYADDLCNQLADTDEFKQKLDNYFNNFTDITNIGDKK